MRSAAPLWVLAAVLGSSAVGGCSLITSTDDFVREHDGALDTDAAHDGDSGVEPDADASDAAEDTQTDVVVIPDGATECTTSTECARLVCEDGYCQGCTSHDQCAPEVCSDPAAGGVCTRCTSNEQCAPEICNSISGECESCSVNADCDEGLICSLGSCGPCADGAECAPLICDEASCRQCTMSAECGAGYACTDPTRECRRECTMDLECKIHDPSLVCVSGYCMGCDEDDDGWAASQTCEDYEYDPECRHDCPPIDCGPTDPAINPTALVVCNDGILNSCGKEPDAREPFREIGFLPLLHYSGVSGATAIDIAGISVDLLTGEPAGGWILLTGGADGPVLLSLEDGLSEALQDYLVAREPTLPTGRFTTLADADLSDLSWRDEGVSTPTPWLTVFGVDTGGDDSAAIYDVTSVDSPLSTTFLGASESPVTTLLDSTGSWPLAVSRTARESVQLAGVGESADTEVIDANTEDLDLAASASMIAIRGRHAGQSRVVLWNALGDFTLSVGAGLSTEPTERPAIVRAEVQFGDGMFYEVYAVASVAVDTTAGQTIVDVLYLECRDNDPSECSILDQVSLFTEAGEATLPLAANVVGYLYGAGTGGSDLPFDLPLLFAVWPGFVLESPSTPTDFVGLEAFAKLFQDGSLQPGETGFPAPWLVDESIDIVDYDVAVAMDDSGNQDLLVAILTSTGEVLVNGARLCKEY